LSPISQSNTQLFSTSGQTRGAPGSIAVARSVMAGRTSYSTVICSAASRASLAVSAITNATGSPTWRIAPSAKAGCGGLAMFEPSRFCTGAAHGIGAMPSAFKSTAV
jgi:hypothetical protein